MNIVCYFTIFLNNVRMKPEKNEKMIANYLRNKI